MVKQYNCATKLHEGVSFQSAALRFDTRSSMFWNMLLVDFLVKGIIVTGIVSFGWRLYLNVKDDKVGHFRVPRLAL